MHQLPHSMTPTTTSFLQTLLLFTSHSLAFSFSTNHNLAHKNWITRQAKSSSVEDDESSSISRKLFFRDSIISVGGVLLGEDVANAADDLRFSGDVSSNLVAVESSLLEDLPPEAQRSYLQYRIPLQISADFYMWELQGKMEDTDEWGEVNSIFQVNNNKGQGNPSRVERDFTNPMRILALSMPPDIADEMRDAQFAFERAAFNINKATKGVKRDMPVEVDPAQIKLAKSSWEDGRVALNKFFTILNEAVGLNEIKSIPPSGPNQTKEYGRSQRRYFELTKKTRLCQNRGGPTLSQAWGGLMVTGYLQDSCGIPDLEDYFYQ